MANSKYIVFERTGETRQAMSGEWFEDVDGGVTNWNIDAPTNDKYPILRPIPADRVTVTVKPEPEAWYAKGTRLYERATGTSWYMATEASAQTLADNMNAVVARLRALEGQVNRG